MVKPKKTLEKIMKTEKGAKMKAKTMKTGAKTVETMTAKTLTTGAMKAEWLLGILVGWLTAVYGLWHLWTTALAAKLSYEDFKVYNVKTQDSTHYEIT